MKKRAVFFKAMLSLNVCLLLFLPAAGGEEEKTVLQWRLEKGRTFTLIRQSSASRYVNGSFESHKTEKNIVNFAIDSIRLVNGEKQGKVKGIFKTFIKGEGDVESILDRTFHSDFIIRETGAYIVPADEYQPSLRSLPTFSKEAVAPGSEWEAPYEIFYHEMDPPFVLENRASYKYLSNKIINGYRCAVILIKFQFKEDLKKQLGNKKADQIKTLIGSSQSFLFWNLDQGAPLYQVDWLKEDFKLNGGSTVTYEMKFVNAYDVVHPLYNNELKNIQAVFASIARQSSALSSYNDKKGAVLVLGEELFDVSGALTAEAETLLRQLRKTLLRYSQYEVVVDGHDADMSANQRFVFAGKNRAESTANFFASLHPQIGAKIYTLGAAYYNSQERILATAADSSKHKGAVAVRILQSGR